MRLPTGGYSLRILRSAVDSEGRRLKLTLEVNQGEYSGHRISTAYRFNPLGRLLIRSLAEACGLANFGGPNFHARDFEAGCFMSHIEYGVWGLPEHTAFVRPETITAREMLAAFKEGKAATASCDPMPLPPGQYVLRIRKCEHEHEDLRCTFEVASGEKVGWTINNMAYNMRCDDATTVFCMMVACDVDLFDPRHVNAANLVDKLFVADVDANAERYIEPNIPESKKLQAAIGKWHPVGGQSVRFDCSQPNQTNFPRKRGEHRNQRQGEVGAQHTYVRIGGEYVRVLSDGGTACIKGPIGETQHVASAAELKAVAQQYFGTPSQSDDATVKCAVVPDVEFINRPISGFKNVEPESRPEDDGYCQCAEPDGHETGFTTTYTVCRNPGCGREIKS